MKPSYAKQLRADLEKNNYSEQSIKQIFDLYGFKED